MSRAATIPAETDLLCERCGYVLTGLSDQGRCPECGTPIAESTTKNPRRPPAWERNLSAGVVRGFTVTTAAIIFAPAQFFRTMTARAPVDWAIGFALIHWSISSMLMGYALWEHLEWVQSTGGPRVDVWLHPVLLVIVILLSLMITTRIATRLTSMEASYRGIRLPLTVVRRAMHYHAAHYLPVAIAALAIILSGQHLMHRVILAPTVYLYILCGYVIVAAIYLFQTYWIGMRNVMYANR